MKAGDLGEVGRLASELGYSEDVVAQLGALWGKSAAKGGGTASLLLCHLLDTAAVAEQMWAHYLAPKIRALLDDLAGGDGRRLFMWLCAVHDCGKATPAFQAVDGPGALRVRGAGLEWNDAAIARSRWRHDVAGAKLLHTLLRRPRVNDAKRPLWKKENLDWLWPLIAGHHGLFPPKKVLKSKQARTEYQGQGQAWSDVQEAVIAVLSRALGYADVSSVEPVRAPNRAEQLTISGLIVMADWLASAHQYFSGIDDLTTVSLAESQSRAAQAWKALRLRGGWGSLPIPPSDVLAHRFGDQARPYQRVVIDAARAMPAPGLMILQAPMGEGKTKAALAAAEVLAARFGADGVFVGMPTQATSDPMYHQVCVWARTFDPDLADQVSLLHGKARFNPEWRRMHDNLTGGLGTQFAGVGVDLDEHRMPDIYGTNRTDDCGDRLGPAEWFLGRKRGLLSGLAVGTIDQLLHAATRTKHVMLRFAGLAGKVVILDEVHAADIYMEQFLAEALWWLAHAGVPVILLTATLNTRQRDALAQAYLSGAAGQERFPLETVPDATGYPNVTTLALVDGRADITVEDAPSWRPSAQMAVEILPHTGSGTTAVVERVCRDLAEGGVALIIHNTVNRAQETFTALRRIFGEDVRLLHGRLNAAHRADRTAACLDLLGPSPTTRRPHRLVVVATQIAEQSFDVDADLLITDLAPMDLLLQRAGRLHRHTNTNRPSTVDTPRLVVTGVESTGAKPRFLKASEQIYGRHRLLRAAALVIDATESGWIIPAEVPALVAKAYGSEALGPPSWQDTAREAAVEWERLQAERARRTDKFRLTKRGERAHSTLEGLHEAATPEDYENPISALVRDGEPSVEVVIVRRTRTGYTAWNGTPIGVNGEASSDVLETVLGGTTRLPAHLTENAESSLRPLPGWRDDPWLAHATALILEEDGTTHMENTVVAYDNDLGLVVRRK